MLGILYESFIHTADDSCPACRRRGWARCSPCIIFKIDLSLYAFVGIIMLIGIVKKNAIMMIDFALEKERNEGTPAAGEGDRTRPA